MKPRGQYEMEVDELAKAPLDIQHKQLGLLGMIVELLLDIREENQDEDSK